MKGKDEGFEFDAALGPGGIIQVPAEILRGLGPGGGGRMRVRLTPVVIAEELERRNVTHGEVERIASLQLEARSQVIAFLLSEGALARGAGKKRRGKRGRR